MRKALMLLIPILLIQCKSDKSYNEVVSEATQATSEITSSLEVEKEISSEDTTDLLDVTDEVEEEAIAERTLEEELKIPEKKEVANLSIPKKRSKPVISFDNYIYQFGTITEGDVIEHNFNFTNTGKATLNIKSSSATCGCTVPSYPFIPIEPGEKGFIGVTYNSIGKSGKQTPVITVVSNATEPVVKLRMTGEVVKKKTDVAESEKQI